MCVHIIFFISMRARLMLFGWLRRLFVLYLFLFWLSFSPEPSLLYVSSPPLRLVCSLDDVALDVKAYMEELKVVRQELRDNGDSVFALFLQERLFAIDDTLSLYKKDVDMVAQLLSFQVEVDGSSHCRNSSSC